MKKELLYLIGLFIISLSVAQAQTKFYKWVDDNGQVHYSEKAPDKRHMAKEMHLHGYVPRTATITLKKRKQKRNNLLHAFNEKRNLRKHDQAQKKKQDVYRRQNCILARDQLKNYLRATALYKLNKKGKRIYLSGRQRSRAEANLKSKIRTWCN